MKKQLIKCMRLAAILCGQILCCGNVSAAEATAGFITAPASHEERACPGNRLPLAPVYWQRATAQLQWQVTDQQIGWFTPNKPLQLAQFSGDVIPTAARPVRQQSWRHQQRDLLFWQQPDGDLHAARVATGQIEFLWQVPMSANPTWLSAPLTILSTRLAGQAAASLPSQAGMSALLLVGGKAGQAVQIVHLQDGRVEPINTPDSIGSAIANPVAFDTDRNGEIDRIYFINTQQQIWRLDWRQAEQWQPRLIARIDGSVGTADAALQGWPAHWPVSQAPHHMEPPVAMPKPLLSAPTFPQAHQTDTQLSHRADQINITHGELLLMLTRRAAGYGLLLVKVATEPGPVIEIGTTPVNTDPTATDFPVHQRSTQDVPAESLLATDSYWWLQFRERPVHLPVVLGSVTYLPVTRPTDCPFPTDYQQVLALNLLNGAPVYEQRYLQFRQPQTSGLSLRALASGFSLGTSHETLLPQVSLIDPQCQFCVRPMTADLLSQRRWLAGYLAEEAF